MDGTRAGATSDTTCTVCCESYDRSAKKRTACAHCGYAACRTCIRRFIVSPGSGLDASCMNCRVAWHPDFVSEAVAKVFVAGQYRDHRENVLFEREISLFPFTQQTIEATREIAAVDKRLRHLKVQQASLKRRRHLLTRRELGFPEPGAATPSAQDLWQSTVVMACPGSDCKGFVTTGRMRCGLCEVQVCRECRETLLTTPGETAHACDPRCLSTVALLRTDTKACPSCASPIFKISGCDQMWCVSCHTAFSWATGRIVDANTEHVHNPEFYRFLRGQNDGVIPRNAGEPLLRPCNATGPSLQELMGAVVGLAHTSTERIISLHRQVYHLRVYTIPGAYKLEPFDMTVERRHILLRRQYMLGEVDEEAFRTLLRTREKRRHRTEAFRELCNTFVQICMDVFNTLKPRMSERGLARMLAQLEAGRIYFNQSMVILGRRHGGCKRMYLTELWNTLFVP